jgi:hypothetical protein
MDDKDLDRLLADMRSSYNVPPTPPLDSMWDGIERARGDRRRAANLGRMVWWIGMAAALVVGVGIGRFTRPTAATVAGADAPSSAALRSLPPDSSYDRATTRYLGQTAALFVALPAEARTGRADERFVARAVDLLTTTRLLLDSPAASDPRVRALLEDVELVLAQVATLESDRVRVEFELIAQALEQRDLLPRLTSAVAGSGEADD